MYIENCRRKKKKDSTLRVTSWLSRLAPPPHANVCTISVCLFFCVSVCVRGRVCICCWWWWGGGHQVTLSDREKGEGPLQGQWVRGWEGESSLSWQTDRRRTLWLSDTHTHTHTQSWLWCCRLSNVSAHICILLLCWRCLEQFQRIRVFLIDGTINTKFICIYLIFTNEFYFCS